MSAPLVGDIIHVRHSSTSQCIRGRVEEVGGNVLVIDCNITEPHFGKHTTGIHDELQQVDGSWHWPHADGQPSLNIECLARLDLRPDEVLAVTLGIPNLKPAQLQEFQEWLTDRLAEHGQPVAGVLVLPQGSQLAAIRPPKDETPSGTLPDNWGGLNRAEIREALESAASIKHLREGYGL